jgi:uncharacterized protein (DUF58 family)
MKRLSYRLFSAYFNLRSWMGRKLTAGGFTLLCFLIITAFVGADTLHTNVYQIVTFLFALLLFAVGTSFRFQESLSVKRVIPRIATAGVPLRYTLYVRNHSSKLQSGLKLLENPADPRPTLHEFLTTPEPGEAKRNPFDRSLGYYRWLWLMDQNPRFPLRILELPPLPPHGEVEVLMDLMPSRRGILRLTGVTLLKPDPFGLFHACQKLSHPHSLVVLPRRYSIPPLALPGLRQYQSGGVMLASSVGDAQEFRSLRDYRPGDPLRNIHWKSWAKMGKPIVKEEQDEFFVRHALILDTFQSSQHSPELEAAVSIAASLACQIRTQESLLDLMFVGLEAYCFTTGRGVGHTEKMLEILAGVIPCRDKNFDTLPPLVKSRVPLLSGCVCLFLCWDQPRQDLVRYLKGMGIPTQTLIMTTSAEWGEQAPDLGRVHWIRVEKLQEDLVQI